MSPFERIKSQPRSAQNHQRTGLARNYRDCKPLLGGLEVANSKNVENISTT